MRERCCCVHLHGRSIVCAIVSFLFGMKWSRYECTWKKSCFVVVVLVVLLSLPLCFSFWSSKLHFSIVTIAADFQLECIIFAGPAHLISSENIEVTTKIDQFHINSAHTHTHTLGAHKQCETTATSTRMHRYIAKLLTMQPATCIRKYTLTNCDRVVIARLYEPCDQFANIRVVNRAIFVYSESLPVRLYLRFVGVD